MRNLDIATLRALVAVADAGGVTRAAGFLNLTQSAVSMQLKRLEELLGVDLLDRTGRGIAFTANGDHLLKYARRMVAMNDEAVTKLTVQEPAATLRLGVPHDIVYPAIPEVLKQFNAAHPSVRVLLESSNTRTLKSMFAKGECDIILTTETKLDSGGVTLAERPLRWVGAPGGAAWRQRPLSIAYGRLCTFRPQAVAALDEADIGWQMLLETDNDSAIHATVSADLAIHTAIEGTEPQNLTPIKHGGALPELPEQKINLYQAEGKTSEALLSLVRFLKNRMGKN
ncbi:LysR family transcriptional regulator [Sulfitobacter donghicola]|uniref:LysR family transcriptional regulator n=1 Tax=Sulfitobacter donghicola DSW-25 = KCTC 12864 = JCM 14565 TaxID=1300350 RepID=A0A073IHR4_9RHOB|nr:LysR family transcriptional regulator [Sulfitobacter donghicola]KEJ89888.1 LysR family transcriptional regulator [Sulfitobacter donghicola DSW-25 = KCTC 12864 = JCM 14565]KIN66987.1 putative HTH-type transcriptional regulator, lysR family [Sulfitobacter donghicola DSW-25 = KCTC 12864 = JCM 14565]